MIKKIASWLGNLPIRYKFLVVYSVVFAMLMLLSGGVTYVLVRKTLEQSIASELATSTASILSMVETSASGAIRSYLRSVAERNLEIVQDLHDRFRRGEITEEEARRRAEEVILSQKIGETGYVCSLDSAGVVRVHPKQQLLGKNLSEYEFVRQLRDRKQGYLEYEWQNPEDEMPRPKAMSMEFFEPWDWIIIASAYRDEFVQLVNIDDFRESVLSLKFGKSGYAYVLDTDGKAIIHPTVEGINIVNNQVQSPDFFDEMRNLKSGRIQYAWRNPGESEPRQKLVIFDHIPHFDWIVASSSYLDEVYAPLNKVRDLFIFTLLGSLVLVLPLTFRVTSSIIKPLNQLTQRFAQGVTGDFSQRVEVLSNDEVGRMASYFNTFMERLEEYSADLRAEISERKEAEEALRESEERYRSVMEATPDPIAVYDMEGRVAYFNPAFSKVFGWSLDECEGQKMDHFVPEECWPETREGIEKIMAGKTLSGVGTRRMTRRGETRDVSIAGATFRGRDGAFVGSVMILRDITERVQAERALGLSEEMFHKAFQSSPNGITITTLKDRKFLNVNDSFLEMVGYEREEVLGSTGKGLALFSSPEVGPTIMRKLEMNDQLRGFEVELHTKTGEVRLGRVSAEKIVIWDEPCMLATIEDVTQARRLEREVIESGDLERRKIGQDLHDDLGPHLIGIEVLSKVLEKKAGEDSQTEIQYAEKIRSLIGEAIEKTRALAQGLCPVHLVSHGLEFALRELTDSTQGIYGITCEFSCDAQVLIENNSVATQLFYIAREAVHNAVKHANAEKILVKLDQSKHKVLISVADDGVGINSDSSGKGMGLQIMEYRARMIGGSVSLETTPERGTTLTVAVPFGKDAEENA